MHPQWRTHRIGGSRLRKVWRLTPGTAIRSNVDLSSWGEVVAAGTIWSPAAAINTDCPYAVQLGIKSVLDCGRGRLRVHYFKSEVDYRVAAYTTVKTRTLEGRHR